MLEADAGMPIHRVTKEQEHTAEACIKSVQRINGAGNVAIFISFSLSLSFRSPPTFEVVSQFTVCGYYTAVEAGGIHTPYALVHYHA
jgi:hypothetical protein